MHYQNWTQAEPGWRWANFSPRELACKGTGQLRIDEAALDRLQALRTRLGRPIVLTSAYRSPEHNRRVGGAGGSLHLQGRAFDVRMDNHDPHEFEAAAREVGFTGFGYYPKQGFMHIDTGSVRTWGTPFPRSKTALPPEPRVDHGERASAASSTTVQASAVQIASGAGAAVAAVGALDGTAQVFALAFGAIVVLAGIWIMRERLRKWAAGER